MAIFAPAGKVQAPKLREAIKSLKLAKTRPYLAKDGIIRKINQPKGPILEAMKDGDVSAKVSDPSTEFNVQLLPAQIRQECVFPRSLKPKNEPEWGGPATNEFEHCIPLVSRIESILLSSAFNCVFRSKGKPLTEKIDSFLSGEQRVMRICMSGVAHEYQAKEIVANVMGRYMLTLAREGKFKERPVLLIVDEAHNFLGTSVGTEETNARRDAFEVIAREGRKYGLCLCLATQRPQDLTPGVLSQVGTFVVHRLTNGHDRQIVERACGDIDRSVAALLPNLQAGEAIFVGIDFPIPLSIRINVPQDAPESDGPQFTATWSDDGATSTGASADNP